MNKKNIKLWLFPGLMAITLIIAINFYYLITPTEMEAQTGSQNQVETGVIEVNPPEAEMVLAPQLSPEEMEAFHLGWLERREKIAGEVDNNPISPPGLPALQGRPSVTSDAQSEFHGIPGTLVIGRNNKNTNANNAAKGSTLAEPAAANNGLHVFAAGNLNHAEWSINGGATWTDVALPAGPAEAPTQWGDHDVTIDDARRVFFHSAMYLNSAKTNGIVRIFVRRTPPGASCSYDIDPGGTADNVVPDYPHIGLTKRYLYLTVNAIPTTGTGFARIYRFNIDSMVDCVGTAYATYTQSFATYGQRVWVPAEGTNNIETMYWGQLDNSSTIRIFSWSETLAAPSAVTRTITATNFTNPDCRGGTGNYDFIQFPPAYSIAGFSVRGVAAPGAIGGQGLVAFFWNAGTDALHTQGHVHGAAFRMYGLGLYSQPVIYNNTYCYGFPVVTANKRGDIGLSIASGGKSGGLGTAARGYVAIEDEFTSGISFGSFTLTASGTHNRSDGRFGDYFTIHPYEPCEKWFTATNYSLLNGAAVANVNSRYIEFGRKQSERCYRSHYDDIPNYLPAAN